MLGSFPGNVSLCNGYLIASKLGSASAIAPCPLPLDGQGIEQDIVGDIDPGKISGSIAGIEGRRAMLSFDGIADKLIERN